MKYLKYLFSLIFGLLFIMLPAKVLAFCPVCTIAVAAGVGLSRWLKIDDTITGVWIGGAIVSMIAWTLNWFQKKKFGFKGLPIITTILYYALIILPLYYSKIIGHPLNTLWGIDKLLFGIMMGSVGFVIGLLAYELIKDRRKKPLFHFQKIVMVIAPLVIFSGIFYLITRFSQ